MSTITSDDIISIVDYFGAAWPWAAWNEQTIAVWIDGLADPNLGIDGAIAMTVARRCAKRWERPGSLAAFLAEYRNESERHTTTAATKELESASRPAQALRMLELARAAIGGAEHDHRKGWEGCTVCVAAVKRQHQHLAEGCAYCRTIRAEAGPPQPLPATQGRN